MTRTFLSHAVFCVSLSAMGLACNTDDDCSLNGICTASACVCVPEWAGPQCATLNLAPARPRPMAGFDEVGNSSWGGSIVQDGGVYHMFVSRMAGHCGLSSWQQNSEIVHATSEDPEGPYEYNRTVLPHFAHGPSVRKIDRGYLMMHLGCGRPFVPFVTGCKNGTTHPKANIYNSTVEQSPGKCTQFNVSTMTAPTIFGPWSDSLQVYLNSGKQLPSWYVQSGRQFSNPAPHVMQNGSILCAYRADARSGGEHVSVASAASAAGPYVDERAHPAVAHNGEDPFLWQDERKHWHMLMHNMGGAVGSHAFSRDAKTWTRSDAAPYTSKVTFSDGSAKNMHRRERPQLLLSATGQPRYFSSGVEDESDHTYTLVMKVMTK